ncbi:MAG: tetratricopeptide repeat protein [Phycisphaerae bacterium]|nr:tetratricopeptide repeat protein [Phycisphaerae bacterium]
MNQPTGRSARNTARRTAHLVAWMAIASAMCFAGGCSKKISVGLPPGLAEDEARRLNVARQLASEAQSIKDPSRAAEKYKDAVREYREFPSAWTNLGVLMMNDQQYLQAAEAFNTAAELDATDPRPLYNLGLLYDRRGYLREARSYYEKALDRDDNFLPALRGVIRADSLLSEGSSQTLRWLERALMLEQDRKWQEWMRLQKARIESLPAVRAHEQF